MFDRDDSLVYHPYHQLTKQLKRDTEMKNADMPAMPVLEPNNISAGLTKREMFAMHAPEVPEWFKKDWEKLNSEVSELFVFEDSYCGISNVAYQYPEISSKGQMVLMKDWRYAYADMML